MTNDQSAFLQELLTYISQSDFIKASEIPNIALYMDQITTFMDAHLDSTKRHDSDKILTKTMINNYTKNKLLPPSEKKKYSSDHMLLLIFIYYLKSFLSITDIQSILTPMTEKYFGNTGQFSLTEIYERIVDAEHEQSALTKEDITKQFERSLTIFEDANEDDARYLQLFSFICLLSFDVYTKKQLIEGLVDRFLKDDEN